MIRQTDDADRNFDANLLALGGQAAMPPGLSGGARAACLAALDGRSRGRRRGLRGVFGRPALLSTIGLAAALVLAIGLFFPTGSGPTVRAAVVLEKLAAQVQGNEVLEIVLDAVSVEEVSTQGWIQIADKAIAGEIRAVVEHEPGSPPIEVELSLGVSEAGGWVLLRKLIVPVDPQAAAIIAGLFPPGTETLLTFPTDAATEIFEEEVGDEVISDLGELRSLATGQLAKFLKEVINSQADVGATVANQPDGTVLVSIAVRDAESLRKLTEIAKTAMGETDGVEIDISDDDAKELFGCSLRVVYDPRTEAVRSFSVSDVGEMKGTVTVSLRGGTIDPALLDAARVTTPNTRTFDAGALLSIAKAMEQTHKSKE